MLKKDSCDIIVIQIQLLLHAKKNAKNLRSSIDKFGSTKTDKLEEIAIVFWMKDRQEKKVRLVFFIF